MLSLALAAVLASLNVPVLQALALPSAPRSVERFEPLRLEPAAPGLLPLRSSGVTWHGNTYHLLTLTKIEFSLDRATGHLVAKATAGLTSFDQVDYDVHIAVLDGAGSLLGTARSKCRVQRIWVTNVMATSQTLDFDFGSSLDYATAVRFTVAISRMKVLTPDDWQK